MKLSDQVVIVTTTFYKSLDELRFRLACDMVTLATSRGYKVVVVDGSPANIQDSVRKVLTDCGAIIFPQLHKSMGPSRRQAFFHAWELAMEESVPYILWMEPEKVDLVNFVEEVVYPMSLHYTVDDYADIVIPGRTERSKSTWPTFQMESERKAAEIYNEVFGGDGFDTFFGPVAFKTEERVARHFILFNPGLYGTPEEVPDTNIQLFIPPIAKSAGCKVTSIRVDMTYPPEQRVEEEGELNDVMKEKRRHQFETLTAGFRNIARHIGEVYKILEPLSWHD
jgi:hypothetical protein